MLSVDKTFRIHESFCYSGINHTIMYKASFVKWIKSTRVRFESNMAQAMAKLMISPQNLNLLVLGLS